ncbi:MAG: hypothetical protein RIK87_28695 [Fuerstiella sp.]
MKPCLHVCLFAASVIWLASGWILPIATVTIGQTSYSVRADRTGWLLQRFTQAPADSLGLNFRVLPPDVTGSWQQWLGDMQTVHISPFAVYAAHPADRPTVRILGLRHFVLVSLLAVAVISVHRRSLLGKAGQKPNRPTEEPDR